VRPVRARGAPGAVALPDLRTGGVPTNRNPWIEVLAGAGVFQKPYPQIFTYASSATRLARLTAYAPTRSWQCFWFAGSGICSRHASRAQTLDHHLSAP